MQDRDAIIHEMHIVMGKYDALPPGHPMRNQVMERINAFRWVLGMPPVRTQPGGDLAK